MSVPKEELHHLVERLPEPATEVAHDFLLWLVQRHPPAEAWAGMSLFQLAGQLQGGPPDLAAHHDAELGREPPQGA